MKRTGSATATVNGTDEYKIQGAGESKIDPVIMERLKAIANVLNSLELDPSLWDPKNPIWQNSNNHVMLMLRHYYHENEKDQEMYQIFGTVIDHLVWLYVTTPDIRARVGWIMWFIILYVTDNQFKEEHGVAFNPEPWTDPRAWITARYVENPVTIKLEPKETPP